MSSDVAFAFVRVIAGLVVAGHGAQKRFGWFAGPGFTGWSGAVARMGFKRSRAFALASAFAEAAGGIALALGLLTPLAAALVTTMMVVAAIKVHWRNGFWAAKGGYELPFVLGTTAAVAGVAGPGAYSVDSLLGLPASAIVFVALTAAGCLAAVFASRAQAASSAAAKVA